MGCCQNKVTSQQETNDDAEVDLKKNEDSSIDSSTVNDDKSVAAGPSNDLIWDPEDAQMGIAKAQVEKLKFAVIIADEFKRFQKMTKILTKIYQALYTYENNVYSRSSEIGIMNQLLSLVETSLVQTMNDNRLCNNINKLYFIHIWLCLMRRFMHHDILPHKQLTSNISMTGIGLVLQLVDKNNKDDYTNEDFDLDRKKNYVCNMTDTQVAKYNKCKSSIRTRIVEDCLKYIIEYCNTQKNVQRLVIDLNDHDQVQNIVALIFNTIVKYQAIKDYHDPKLTIANINININTNLASIDRNVSMGVCNDMFDKCLVVLKNVACACSPREGWWARRENVDHNKVALKLIKDENILNVVVDIVNVSNWFYILPNDSYHESIHENWFEILYHIVRNETVVKDIVFNYSKVYETIFEIIERYHTTSEYKDNFKDDDSMFYICLCLLQDCLKIINLLCVNKDCCIELVNKNLFKYIVLILDYYFENLHIVILNKDKVLTKKERKHKLNSWSNAQQLKLIHSCLAVFDKCLVLFDYSQSMYGQRIMWHCQQFIIDWHSYSIRKLFDEKILETVVGIFHKIEQLEWSDILRLIWIAFYKNAKNNNNNNSNDDSKENNDCDIDDICYLALLPKDVIKYHLQPFLTSRISQTYLSMYANVQQRNDRESSDTEKSSSTWDMIVS